MGDTGQIYSEAPRPGCQLVLRGFHNTCLRWIFFSSIEGLRQEIREELGESCWHAGKIWPTSPGSLKDNGHGRHGRHGIIKTSMRSGKTSDTVFLNELKPSDVRLLPLYLGKILSSQGLQGLWMFGDTGQAMGLHLRSTSHGGHGY